MSDSPPGPMVATAERLPPALGSIRVRLTVLYSTLLFGLAAIVVGMIYVGLSRSIDDLPNSRNQSAVLFGPDGTSQPVDVLSAENFEREINRRTLDQLRTYSFSALGLLFIASLGVGWYVSGLALRPMGRITRVAREIQATDLSRRIDLRGPNDEIRQLADTFDGMLGRLDDAFENQRQFIQEASHELRNPIAVIRTNVDVALDDPEASVDELRQTAVVVGRAAERMTTLVDDLLNYARHGVPATRRETLQLASLVDDAVVEFRASAIAAGIELEATAPIGITVMADRSALQRALANLLANAIRESSPGTCVRVGAGRQGSWAWLAVEDEGPGIRPEDQERAFQRFWRGNRHQARVEGRSGLGLTIVRQIAEAHGGRVDLRSEVGVGSTFVIWLPAEPSSVSTASEGEKSAVIAAITPPAEPTVRLGRALTRTFGTEA